MLHWPDSQIIWRALLIVGVLLISYSYILMTYNTLAFGSPLKFGYSLSAQQGWPLMQQGLMGVTYPKAGVLREVLVGRYRGILPLAPELIAAPFGFFLLWKETSARAAAIAAATISVYYAVLSASYVSWDGGYSYGPRYLGAGLPFLCLPLALVWTRRSWAWRLPLLATGLYGAFISLMAVSTDSMPSTRFKSPVQQVLWPAFHTGQLSQNLGTLAGLPGLRSLIPLLALWGASIAAWAYLNAESTPKVHIKFTTD